MTTQPITRIAALLAATTTLVGAFAACGDTNNITNVNCGAGTVLKDGTCVAVTDATTDTGAADTGTEVPDSSGGSDGSIDGSPGDAAADAAPDTDDPCPTPPAGFEFINCDATCGAVNSRCASTWCSSDGTLPKSFQPILASGLVIRTTSSALHALIRMPRDPSSVFGHCDGPRARVTATNVKLDPTPRGAFAALMFRRGDADAHNIKAVARGYTMRPALTQGSVTQRPVLPDFADPPQQPLPLDLGEPELVSALPPKMQPVRDCYITDRSVATEVATLLNGVWRENPWNQPSKTGDYVTRSSMYLLFVPSNGVGARNILISEEDGVSCP
jgi:hypothetical protein